ncbi:MAG: polymer-forming cytoskeletal protein [Proteobacteria bacterium]|nr:polymer-forming cytoskeletal protein [Pseudomonadota bacterium]
MSDDNDPSGASLPPFGRISVFGDRGSLFGNRASVLGDAAGREAEGHRSSVLAARSSLLGERLGVFGERLSLLDPGAEQFRQAGERESWWGGRSSIVSGDRDSIGFGERTSIVLGERTTIIVEDDNVVVIEQPAPPVTRRGLSLVGWIVTGPLAALLFGACMQGGSVRRAPGAPNTVPIACVDLDGDGYGAGCALGSDCDDTDPAQGRQCHQCVRLAEGCECGHGTAPVSCKLAPSTTGDGLTICHAGKRYCREGTWTGCEGVQSYLAADHEPSALVDPDTGVEQCDACSPKCFRVRDYLDPVPEGLTAANSRNVAWSEGGGLVLKPGGGDLPEAVCPPYHEFCEQGCVSVADNPAHCGDCGVACASGEVCSAGACKATCETGLSPCGNSCINTLTSNAHCGGCGSACGAGLGCVAGSCVALRLPPPDPEAELGDPISVAALSQNLCAGSLARQVFTHALCACGGVEVSGPLVADAYDSRTGPYLPNGLGGHVGLNQGRFTAAQPVEIWGDLTHASHQELELGDEARVHRDLRVAGTATIGSSLQVAGDMYVAGDIRAENLDVSGTLHKSSSALLDGSIRYGRLETEAVAVATPCGTCARGPVVVPAIVQPRKHHNDNDRIGLSADLIKDTSTRMRIDLPAGHYYLDEITSGAELTLVAHGRVALYIAGNVDLGAAAYFDLEPGAELDMFVGGELRARDRLFLGNPNYPAMLRLYIGGPTGRSHLSDFSGDTVIAGSLFAANPTRVTFSGRLELFGAASVGHFEASNDVKIHFDRMIERGGSCLATAPSAPTYTAGSYWQDIDSRKCRGTERPDWSDLMYSADMPDGTEIVFEACSADEAQDTGHCSLTTVARVQAGGPCRSDADCSVRSSDGSCIAGVCQYLTGNACLVDKECGSGATCHDGVCEYIEPPADIGVAIGRANNFLKHARIKATLKPDSAGARTPKLNQWSASYECLPIN